jgi:hypothetical protein
MYSTKPAALHELRLEIESCTVIPADILMNVHHSVVHCYEQCLEINGDHFEHCDNSPCASVHTKYQFFLNYVVVIFIY